MTFLFFTSFYYFANSSACLCSAVLTLKLIRQKKRYPRSLLLSLTNKSPNRKQRKLCDNNHGGSVYFHFLISR